MTQLSIITFEFWLLLSNGFVQDVLINISLFCVLLPLLISLITSIYCLVVYLRIQVVFDYYQVPEYTREEMMSKKIPQRCVSLGSFISRTTYRWSNFTLSTITKGRNCQTFIKPAIIAGSSLYFRRVFYEANFCPRLLILFRHSHF